MASFVVMEPQARAESEGTVFIRDSFAVFAFLFPPLWFAWHRMWMEAVAAVALLMLASAAASTNLLFVAAPILSFLVSLYAGLEANTLRISSLRQKGWHEAGLIDAKNAEEAELRWFYASGHTISPPPLPAPAMAARHTRPVEGMGLIDYPGSG